MDLETLDFFAAFWQVLLVPILIWSYEWGFSYKVLQLDWAVFGPSEDVYSFRNLVLPKIVTWLVCTLPVGLTVLWLYGKLGIESLKTPLLVVGACSLLLALSVVYYHHRLVNLEGLPEDTKELERGGIHVTDSALIQLRRLPDLERLGLAKSRVTDAGLAHLRRLRTLKWLDLSNTEVTNAGLLQLQGLDGLEGLHLSGTQITDDGLVYLKGLTNLDTLYLGDTEVTDTGLEHLKALTNLANLSLAGTKVTDEGLRHLEALTKLRWLALDGTQVTDERVNGLRQVLTNLYDVRVGPGPDN